MFNVCVNKFENMHELINFKTWKCLKYALINSNADN